MDIAGLIQSYGYLAVAVGTFLEGETVLIVAGAAASHGHLSMPAVIAVAAMAGFVGDQFYFHVGRRYGARLVERFPSLQWRTARVRELLERHHPLLILSIRFLYGLRIAGPIAFGMSSVPSLRFLVLNLAGAIGWASAVAGAGYGFGQTLAYLLGDIDADEVWLGAALLFSGTLGWLVARYQRSAPTRQ